MRAFDFRLDPALACGMAMKKVYPFNAPDPAIAYGASRQWGEFGVRAARAQAGRYEGVVFDEHRIVFYLCQPTVTHCGCDGQTQSRTSIQGDFDFVPGGCDGYWEDTAPVDMISMRLNPRFLTEVAEGLEAKPPANPQPKLGARDPIVSFIAEMLLAELSSPSALSRLQADSLAVALSTRLLHDVIGGAPPARQTLAKPKLRRLIDYVEANLEADLSLSELAEVTGLSIPHLTTLFRRTMGQSLHQYVIERRVSRARALLLSGADSIAEVALATGFAHQSHLARWMRRMLGVTPSQVQAARAA